jgi:hypothetical protein
MPWFLLTNKITYKLSQPSNAFCMDGAIPAINSIWIFEHIYEGCVQICCSNFKIFEPTQFALPAAHIQSILSGVVGMHLPTHDNWVQAYCDKPKLSSILKFDKKLGTISQLNLDKSKLDANYRQALRQSNIMHKNEMLTYCKPIVELESYTHLQLVPA